MYFAGAQGGFDVDSIPILDVVDVGVSQSCLGHQERPEDGPLRDSLSTQYHDEANDESSRTTEDNAHEAVSTEDPMEDIGTENTEMFTFFVDLDLEEFDNTSVGPILDAIENDEFAWIKEGEPQV